MRIPSFRKPFLGFALIALCNAPSGFAQDIMWERSFGGKQAEYLFDMQPTADYGFILAGSSLSGKTGNKADVNKGDLDYLVWKLDEHGETEWQKTFGGSGADLLHCVRNTPDGGFLLAGTSHSPVSGDKTEPSRGQSDFWLIKLDAGGGMQWQKTIGGTSADDLTAVAVLRDGGYYIGGSSSSTLVTDEQGNLVGDKTEKSRGNLDFWILHLDQKGEILWQRTYGGLFSDQLSSLAATTDGGCIAGGWSNSPTSGDKLGDVHGAGDYWILKLDDTGTIQWQKTLGGGKDDKLHCIIQTKDGGYVAGGNSNSGAEFNKSVSSRNGSDFWVVKLDDKGNSLWQESFDFGKSDILVSVVENPDASLLIGGFSKSEAASGKDKEDTGDFIALKIDGKGKELWKKTVGSEGEDVLRKVIITRDGGYVLAGNSNPVAGGGLERIKKKRMMGEGGQLHTTQQAQHTISSAKKQGIDEINGEYRKYAEEVQEATNNLTGSDNPLKMGVALPENVMKDGNDPSNQVSAGVPQDRKMLPSRDKSNNIGNIDFWIVKLKDKEKKEKRKPQIEAIPNPAVGYTNVIIGFDYTKGTASVFDLSGRELQSFKIAGERTVPINFSSLPQGIYLVEIRTDEGSESVKVMNAK